MIEFIELFIVIIILFNLLNFIFVKYSFLIDDFNKLNHKKFINVIKTPITGGILFIFSITLLLKDFNTLSNLIFVSIFILGLLSDVNKLTSPKARLVCQLVIVLLYIYFNNILIIDIRIDYINTNILSNLFYKIIFTSFCILILINGSNFMDGVNTLCSGYYLILFCNIFFLSLNDTIQIDIYNVKIIIIVLFIFFISNSFNKSFMGDSGSYLISFFTALFLINFSNQNQMVSPYFIAVLLWYPVFENFFSLTRRLFFEKKKIKNADNSHLHHLLFIYIKKKIINNKFTNTFTGVIINFFNLSIFIVANNYLYQTKMLILILSIAIISYVNIYFFLKKKVNNLNH